MSAFEVGVLIVGGFVAAGLYHIADAVREMGRRR